MCAYVYEREVVHGHVDVDAYVYVCLSHVYVSVFVCLCVNVDVYASGMYKHVSLCMQVNKCTNRSK